MMFSRRTRSLIIACMAISFHPMALSANVCEKRNAAPLVSFQIFDGSPEEMADLVPDQGGSRTGYWTLNYVYEAGRFVTVRCKYKDGYITDVKLTEKINKCIYQYDAKKQFSLQCK